MTKTSATHRRGGAALVALVCLSVIALVIAGLFRVSLSRAEQVRRIERQCQADWLVEAGLERAAERLKADPAYSGETWAIPGDSLDGKPAGVVIEVEGSEDGEDGPNAVRVSVEFPSEGDLSGRARRSKSFRVSPKAMQRGNNE